MNYTIDIKAESLPWYFRLAGILMIIFSLATFSGSYWWFGVVLIPIGTVLVTYASGTEINLVTKKYREYSSILFFKHGEQQKFDEIERIFINASKVTTQIQTAHTTSGSIFTDIEYNAYLKFSNGKKIFVTSRRNKKDLINQLQPIANRLETELVDYSG
ncbi:MAG TPA: hypothetical protein VFW11_15955 [Cyclobacteriaceae bacterium]|nr:hypothetical protein [Cyclobacteriaceae bacterium]